MPPKPTVLAFDTSAAHCAAALLLGDRVVPRVDPMARGQAEHLMGMLEQVLASENITWADLDAIAVCTGPGNFTGIRIAVSAARGLSLGLGIPAIGVSNFAATVHGLPRPVTACLPAPRDTTYVQTFTETAVTPPVHADKIVTGAPLLEPAALIGNAARIAASQIGQDMPRPAPLYVRAADAAPPRDPAPVILAEPQQ